MMFTDAYMQQQDFLHQVNKIYLLFHVPQRLRMTLFLYNGSFICSLNGVIKPVFLEAESKGA